MSNKLSKTRISWSYIKTLFQFAGARAFVSIVLMVLLGLTQGIGLLMIIPFLHLIGIGGQEGISEGFISFVARCIQFLGLPLNLITVLVIYILIIITEAVMSRYHSVLDAKIIYGYTCFLRNRLYKVIADTEWLNFINTKSSDITHILTIEIQRVAIGTEQLLKLTGILIIAFVHLCVAFLISVPMSIFAIICAGVLFFLLHPLNSKAFLTGKKLHKGLRGMFATVMEHLAGMKITKTYDLDQRNVTQFNKITHGLANEMVRFTKLYTATDMFYKIGAALAISIFFYVSIEVAQMATAHLLLIVFIFARLLPKISTIQSSTQQILNYIPSFESVIEMQKRFDEAKESPLSISQIRQISLKRVLRFHDVSFKYDKGLNEYAIKNVNMTIPVKCMTAIVGPSGAGKSTLADLIMGLLSPLSGRIFIDDEPLRGPLLKNWRQSVGYVPQDTFLFNDTIRTNLLWAQPKASDDEIWNVLRLSRAEGFIKQLPHGLDTQLGDRGINLSGGERQRIALARALLRSPSLLLLDEATSSLDTENEQYIQEAIEGLHGELTIIVIAHRLSTIRKADSIIVLEGGSIIEAGTFEALMKKEGGRFRSMAIA